jgi:hypothetical protein
MFRQSFLAESSELKREWLAELLEGVGADRADLGLALSVLRKSEPKELYTADYATKGVENLLTR